MFIQRTRARNKLQHSQNIEGALYEKVKPTEVE
jgi:hypothetical protein